MVLLKLLFVCGSAHMADIYPEAGFFDKYTHCF